jgi:hypothetical protein
MLNIKLVTWALGIFTGITFVVCVIYGLVTPKSMHMSEFLEMVLPPFKWLTVGLPAWIGRELPLRRLYRTGILSDPQLVASTLGPLTIPVDRYQ